MHTSRILVYLLVCFLFAGNLLAYSPTRSYYKQSSRNAQEEDKRLELIYGINRVEMLYSARKKADKLIKSGKEKIKQGDAMRNARDYKMLMSGGLTGHYQHFSQENTRREGEKIYQEGVDMVEEGNRVIAIINKKIKEFVSDDMMRVWKSKKGQFVRGAILSNDDGRLIFVDEKERMFIMNINLLCKEDIEYINTPKVDINISIPPKIYGGRILAGEKYANELINVEIVPRRANLVKTLELNAKIDVESKHVIGGDFTEKIHLNGTEKYVYNPPLGVSIDYLKGLEKSESVRFNIKCKVNDYEKDRSFFSSICPAKIFYDVSTGVEFNKNIFPSLLLADVNLFASDSPYMYTDGNAVNLKNIDGTGNPFIYFKLNIEDANGFENIKLSYTIESLCGIINRTENDCIVKIDGRKEIYFYPVISWNNKKLMEVKNPYKTSITINYKVNEKETQKVIVSAVVNPVNDVLLAGPGLLGKGVRDYKRMFAAFVNENHPIIEELRKEAIQKGYIKHFYGEQSGDRGVRDQMYAFWRVLRDRKIVYSSAIESFASDSTMFAQRVRFIDESIYSNQANCVDGSVLFASFAKSIGLNPSLVIIPGHMFVLITTKTGYVLPIETTMVGNEGDSFEVFNDAIKGGFVHLYKLLLNMEYAKSMRKHNLKLSRLLQKEIQRSTMLVNIDDCRTRYKIMPVTIVNKDK